MTETGATPTRQRRKVALVSLRGDREFRQVRNRGTVARGPYFRLHATEYRPRHGAPWHPSATIGIVVPKKVLKRAVDRNRVRRRVREALRRAELPACRAIILPNASVLGAPFGELQAQLVRALTQAVPARKSGNLKSAPRGQPGGRRP